MCLRFRPNPEAGVADDDDAGGSSDTAADTVNIPPGPLLRGLSIP